MPDNSGAGTPEPQGMLDQDTKKRVVLLMTAGRAGIALVAAAAAAAALADGTPWIAPPEAAALRNPVAASPLSWQHGGRLFARHCAVCHGEGGKGDGPESGELKTRPADLTDSRRVGKMPDGEIFWKISHGRDPMPPFNRILPDQAIWHLTNFVRSLPERASDPERFARLETPAVPLPTVPSCP